MTGAQRRSQLIDIGRGLFAIRGLDGTTIEENPVGVTDVLAKPLVAADIARSLAGVFNP